MTIFKALRQRAVEHKKVLRGLLDGAAAENRDLNETEAAKYEESSRLSWRRRNHRARGEGPRI